MSPYYQKLLIATGNQGKLIEFSSMFDSILATANVDLVSLSEIANVIEVDETGSTFDENARLKAAGYAVQSGLLTIADDSGLEIEALDGRPGVLSARYGGKDISFAERINLFLEELRNCDTDRRARFVCSIAFALPDGTIAAQESGECEGTIAFQPLGDNGFGYDPIFIPKGYEMTFGQLNDHVKRSFSHRTAAFNKIIPKIRGFIAH